VLYIVSGFMRSGTSMMMEALTAGGMESVYSKKRDQRMNSKLPSEEYIPNESYWEIPLKEYNHFDFPQMYDEKLIKVMFWGLAKMRIIPHKIIYMVRNPMSIMVSWERSFGKSLMFRDKEGEKKEASKNQEEWVARYWSMTKQCIVQAETRRDCESLHVVQYEEVIKEPLSQFQRFVKFDWPIDVEKCVESVQPEKQRC
jgi:hypothetical protein